MTDRMIVPEIDGKVILFSGFASVKRQKKGQGPQAPPECSVQFTEIFSVPLLYSSSVQGMQRSIFQMPSCQMAWMVM